MHIFVIYELDGVRVAQLVARGFLNRKQPESMSLEDGRIKVSSGHVARVARGLWCCSFLVTYKEGPRRGDRRNWQESKESYRSVFPVNISTARCGKVIRRVCRYSPPARQSLDRRAEPHVLHEASLCVNAGTINTMQRSEQRTRWHIHRRVRRGQRSTTKSASWID